MTRMKTDIRFSLLFSITLLILSVWILPIFANSPAFRSTSSYRVEEPHAKTNVGTQMQYEVYRSTTYTPFSSESPSMSSGTTNAPSSGMGGRKNAVIGIPGWGDTMSEPLPIADGTLFLLLLAAMTIATITIKQHKQKQSTTMKQTKHKDHLFFQKLFTLLVFFCFVGQASGQTLYKEQLFNKSKTAGGLNTNFPSKGGSYNGAFQGAYTNGVFYTYDKWKTGLVKISEASTPTLVSNSDYNTTSYNDRTGTCCDDAGNLIINPCYSKLIIIPNGDLNQTKKTLTYTHNDLEASCNYISASGDVMSDEGGYIYFFPNGKTKIYTIKIVKGQISGSITTSSGTTKVTGNAATFVIPIGNNPSTFIYQDRGANPAYYKYTNGTHTALTGAISNTIGGIVFTLNNQNMFVQTANDSYKGGWRMSTLNNPTNYLLTQGQLGSGGYDTNESVGAFFTYKRVNNYVVKLYEYCQGHGIAAWAIGYCVPKNIRIQTYSGSGTSWGNNANGGTISKITYQYAATQNTNSTVTNGTTLNINVDQGTTVGLTATAQSGFTFIGWWNQGVASTSTTYNHPADGTTDASITARFAQCYTQTIRNTVYNPETASFQNGNTGGTITINYDDGTGVASKGTNKTKTVSTSGTYRTIINSTITLKRTTTNTGYIFRGWFEGDTQLSTADTYTYTASAAKNISARFIPIISQTFKVQTYDGETSSYVDGGGGGTITIKHSNNQSTSTSSTVTINNMFQGYNNTLTAVANDGYAFVGWYNYDGTELYTNSTTYVYRAMGTRTITARFIKTKTRIFQTQTYNGTTWQTNTTGGTLNITYNGSTTASTSTANPLTISGIHEGSQIQMQANANAGYQFLYWQCQWSRGTNPNCTINALDSTYNINGGTYSNNSYTARFAKFDQQTFNIRTYSSSADTYVADAASGTIAIAYTYNEFKNILSANKTQTTPVDETHSYTIADVNNHSYDIIEGTSVTLTATPNSGYNFVGWYKGDVLVSASPTYTYAVAEAGITITARFKLAQQTHTVSVMTYDPNYNKYLPDDPGGSITYTVREPGSSTPLQEVTTTTAASFIATTGHDVTLTATAREGYKFLGWYEGETLRSDDATSYTYSATDVARHFTARFAPSNTLTFTLIPNSAGTYTVKYGNANAGIATFSSKQSSLTKREKVIVPNPYQYTVVSAKPILGYAFHCFYFGGYENIANKQEAQFNELSLTQTADRRVVVNFVRTEEQMVYLHLNNQWAHNDHTYYVYAANIAKRTNANETDLQFEWIPMELVAGQNYYKASRPIPANTYSHIVFTQFASGAAAPTVAISELTTKPTNKTDYLTIPATRFNCYKLKSYYKNGAMTDAWTNCPAADGDFRLLYREVSNANYEHASDVIKKATNGKTDIVSLHIYKENNPTLTLQQRTSGTWSDIQTVTPPSTSGVWNFTIQQDGITATVTNPQPYTGNYYIRTVNATGMYQDYTHPDNTMTYSAYADQHSDFSHYFCRYIDIPAQGLGDGNQVGTYTSVKFAVANDYAYFLSKELLISNDRFANDEYGEDRFVEHRDDIEPRLSVDANVRFGWDSKTNRLTRTYIANPEAVGDDYLILEGNNLAATTFNEGADHIYYADLQAKPNTSATVRATTIVDTDNAQATFHLEPRNQYFFGSEGSPALLVGGTASQTTYPIRVTYDFKHDRFTTAYTPNGEITGTVNLETPVMIMREHNNPPTQITFPTEGSNKIVLPNGEDAFAQPAYAVMTFRGNILTDPSITHHEKMFYWISFPFDVKIEDVVGLGDYGKYWIMQYYDGKQRDDYGLKYTNWQYILDTEAILNANQGYIICLNYSQLVTDGIVTSNKNVSLYFPSQNVITPSYLQQVDDVTVTLEEYTSNKAWYHNNWHVIGVPSFANPDIIHNQGDATFIYEYWHPGDAYAAKAADEITFQSMHAYMVQYAGDITWNSVVNIPKNLAARTNTEDKPIMLRLELQQEGNMLDKTYVQLRSDKGTLSFDLNLDLSKIINAGANIYSVVSGDQMAGNVIPKDETVLPIGVVITTAGNYTFAMPNGTGGMIVELIDYEQGTSTNLLAMDYTVNLPKATNNTRFALRLKPNKVATSVENIGDEVSADEAKDVRKLLLDGVLYLQKGSTLYDAQGHIIFER